MPQGTEALGASLELRRSLCSRSLFARSRCRACEEACTLGALRRVGDRLELSPACDLCGACVGACPTGALDTRAPSTAEIEDEIRRNLLAAPGAEVLFVCERAAFPASGAIRIPCAARLDEAMLVAAALEGAGGLWVIVGDCRACSRRDRFLKVFSSVLRSALAILSACGLGRTLIRVGRPERLDARDRALLFGDLSDRRGFFRRIARSVAARLPGWDRAPFESGPAVGKRRRLVASIRASGRPLSPAPAGALALGSLSIDRSRCLGCTVCAHVCAPGAIAREEKPGGEVTLRLDAALCTACGACAEACMPGAIELERCDDLCQLGSPPDRVLATLAPRRCIRCEESFHSASANLCPRCRRFLGGAELATPD